MIRRSRFTFLLIMAALLVPAAAHAQQDTDDTRFAAGRIGLALTQTDPARQKRYYEEALQRLRTAQQRTPENAQVFLLLGRTHVGLGDIASADEAYRRALELHPAYAEEIEIDRHEGWQRAAQRGFELVEDEQYEDAIRALEAANAFYAHRPEAYVQLGGLYLHFDRLEEAQRAFSRVLETTENPPAYLEQDIIEHYPSYRRTASYNLGLITAQLGVQAFQREQFSEARRLFRSAAERSPEVRDYWLNLALAAYNDLIEMRDAREGAVNDQLVELNRGIVDAANELERAADNIVRFEPVFADLYPLLLMAHRSRAEIATEDAEAQRWQAAMTDVLQKHQALAFTIQDIGLERRDDGAITVGGSLQSLTVARGTPIQLRFSLIDRDGGVISTANVSVPAPAANESAQFQTVFSSLPGDAEIASWKYEIIR